jgi:beta-lactamase class A
MNCRRIAMVAAVSLIALAATPAQQTGRPGLQRLLEAELARFPGRAGVWVKHLTLGEEAAVRADETFNSASVIKLPVLVLAFQMAEKGELSLAERITITAADFRGGSGIFRYNDPGLQPTLRDVLLQMVITSDNTATDLAIGKVGGVDRVNAWLGQNGYGGALRLNMTTGELFARYNALARDANRNEKTNSDRGYWLGEMTPRGTGRLIEAIARCSGGTAASPIAAAPATAAAPAIASQKSCADIIRMMRAQQSGDWRLPHFINVPVAHKTGDFPPVLANDVGIIFARSGPIVVSFFGNAIEGPYAEAEDRIGRIAQLIVAYFDGAP